MSYQEIYSTYQELKNVLEQKKQAIKDKNLEKLASVDEECLVINEKLQKFDIPALAKTFSEEQKENLRNLGAELKKIEEHNEMLINHSLNVINNTLSGILNIVQKDTSSYNAKGETLNDKEGLNISSITEEA